MRTSRHPHTSCFKQQSVRAMRKEGNSQPIRFKTSLPQGGGILCQKEGDRTPVCLVLAFPKAQASFWPPHQTDAHWGFLEFYRMLPNVSNFNEEIFHLPFCFQETSLEGIFTSH